MRDKATPTSIDWNVLGFFASARKPNDLAHLDNVDVTWDWTSRAGP
jgi:hypothetical protein